ncbi:hypothetical protein BaRGS_00002315 [Batillaria attramentaria]|uniref:Uncharacterized protein n=1 Tax=Batillaria attramentaria TaxID=370345 RepID=A0ABD0M495_9CAEN
MHKATGFHVSPVWFWPRIHFVQELTFNSLREQRTVFASALPVKACQSVALPGLTGLFYFIYRKASVEFRADAARSRVFHPIQGLERCDRSALSPFRRSVLCGLPFVLKPSVGRGDDNNSFLVLGRVEYGAVFTQFMWVRDGGQYRMWSELHCLVSVLFELLGF